MKKVAVFSLLLGASLLLFTGGAGWAQSRRPGTSPAKKSPLATIRAYQRDRDERLALGNTRPLRVLEMSFRVAPGFSFNSAEGTGAYSQFQPNGLGVRLSLGPSLDYFFYKDRYAFSTGLWYTVNRSSFLVPGSFGQDRFRPGLPPVESVYNLQYLQIPLTVKLYANELGPSLRGYIQCGGLLSIKLAEKALDQPTNPLYRQATAAGTYERQYGFMDVGVLLGAGVQYKINDVNALNLGLSYQRGLVNVVRENALVSRSGTVALELGFKF